jgi:hypothetical protein
MKREAAAAIRNRLVHLNDERRQAERFRERRQRAQRGPLNVGLRIVQSPGKDRPTRLVAEQAEAPGAAGAKQEVQPAEVVERPIGNRTRLPQSNGRELTENAALPNIDQSKLQADFL